jgi:hypothetical protein
MVCFAQILQISFQRGKYMNARQSSEASHFLLALARRNAQIYATHPSTRAILVTGSAAEGVSDFYSDIDMILYYEKLPTAEELSAASQQNQGEGRRILASGEGELLESYQVQGVECQFAHATIATWERDIATVLEELDVTTPLQKALSGTLVAIPIYGEPLIRGWQARIAAYPEALAQAMVSHYLNFFPVWGIQKRMVTRDATIWLHQLLVETAYNLLGVLAGLNRCYYSSFQFKRMRHFIAHLALTPIDFADRLEAVFYTDIASAITQIESLVRETVTMVEQYMPQIDTTSVHQRLERREVVWQLLPER